MSIRDFSNVRDELVPEWVRNSRERSRDRDRDRRQHLAEEERRRQNPCPTCGGTEPALHPAGPNREMARCPDPFHTKEKEAT
jgi:hypothetical protein